MNIISPKWHLKVRVKELWALSQRESRQFISRNKEGVEKSLGFDVVDCAADRNRDTEKCLGSDASSLYTHGHKCVCAGEGAHTHKDVRKFSCVCFDLVPRTVTNGHLRLLWGILGSGLFADRWVFFHQLERRFLLVNSPLTSPTSRPLCTGGAWEARVWGALSHLLKRAI